MSGMCQEYWNICAVSIVRRKTVASINLQQQNFGTTETSYFLDQSKVRPDQEHKVHADGIPEILFGEISAVINQWGRYSRVARQKSLTMVTGVCFKNVKLILQSDVTKIEFYPKCKIYLEETRSCSSSDQLHGSMMVAASSCVHGFQEDQLANLSG